MPIKREHRDRYAENWHELATAIKDACAWECMSCGKQCRRPGEAFDTHQRTLTISHYDNDYASEGIYVVALCAPCHIRHDAQAHAAARQRTYRHRRLQDGQMSLFAQREPSLTAFELAELEHAWPSLAEALEDL